MAFEGVVGDLQILDVGHKVILPGGLVVGHVAQTPRREAAELLPDLDEELGGRISDLGPVKRIVPEGQIAGAEGLEVGRGSRLGWGR